MKKVVKKAVKKPVAKKAVKKPLKIQAPIPITREEVRKVLGKEPVGSAKGYDAAVKMLGFIEQDTQASKTKKVQYFPPIKREEVVKPVSAVAAEKPVQKVANQVAKKAVENLVPQVTLAEICKELKKDPTEVRKMLRDKKVPKPGAQWSWPKTDEKAIKMIRGLVKAMVAS